MRQIAGVKSGKAADATDYEPNVLAGTELNVLTREYQVEVRAALLGQYVTADPAVANANNFGDVYAVFKTGQVELSRQYIAVKGYTINQLKGTAGLTAAVAPSIGMNDDDIIYSGPVPSGTLQLEFIGLASAEKVVWDVKYR